MPKSTKMCIMNASLYVDSLTLVKFNHDHRLLVKFSSQVLITYSCHFKISLLGPYEILISRVKFLLKIYIL